jgi:hypothetical protein
MREKRSFFAELKPGNVFKVGAGYLMAAWLVVQTASIGVPCLRCDPKTYVKALHRWIE